MPDMDGLELAGKIRGDNPFAKIVFVTNHAEFAHKGYIYGAFRYVRKNDLERELCEAVLNLGQLFDLQDRHMSFKTTAGEFIKKVKNIKYFEVHGHNLTIACSDNEGPVQIQGTITEYEKRFGDMGFIRIHKSYLVNFKYIASVEKECVYLTDSIKLPLSRNRANEAKRRIVTLAKNLRQEL